MKKLIIFDLDGTLVDSVNSIAYSGNLALKNLGFKEINTNEYNFLAGDGVDNLLKRMLRLSGDFNLEKFSNLKIAYKETFDKHFLYDLKPYPGIKEVIFKLKDKNIKMAVFSNKLHYYTCKIVEEVFGKDCFDYVLGHKEENPYKPNPKGALIIAKNFNIDTKSCIYVGDTNTDMKTGRSAKMYTVGVSWGFRTESELIEYGAMKVINSPVEILQLI